jgi:HEAT repeat protein
MGHDPATVSAARSLPPRALILEAAQRRDEDAFRLVDAGLADDDALVRMTAFGALVQQGRFSEAALLSALNDPDHAVHQRATQLLVSSELPCSSVVVASLREALADSNAVCVVAALVAFGDLELIEAFDAVAEAARSSRDPLIIEEAIATLGAFGDERGLDLILEATTGKPALRRRCVAALGAFEGPIVEAALDQLAEDRDWQVRQAVAMLRREE